VFAYQTKQQAGFFLKDLVPLAAIGSAYVRGQKSANSKAPASTVVKQGKHDASEFRLKVWSSMKSPKVETKYLADHPELAEQLARISWVEWRSIYEQRGETFDDALRKYRERTNIDKLPLALVALAGNELVGTVSLKCNDLDIRPEHDPWLGALFVIPKWRGRGIGSVLCQRAVEEAARLKIPSLFLWTYSAEGLYLKLGWRAIEHADYCGQRIVIMEYALRS
jgi:predicted N-acetyltransferase YhbS